MDSAVGEPNAGTRRRTRLTALLTFNLEMAAVRCGHFFMRMQWIPLFGWGTKKMAAEPAAICLFAGPAGPGGTPAI